ncbi:MAG TPA: metal-dependent hydrolase [Pyrinomonadaceae bacterium]|jgi:inner membrane protein
MDNLTHSLVGLAAAKAGIERWSPAATTLCVLAANVPDADVLARLGGRWFALQHHRGITHSIVGMLTLAILVPLLFYLGDLVYARLRRRAVRVRPGGLLLASLIVTATHPLMDWTNNYGLRPFLPWSARWYYGDLVFIVDPWLWLTLGGAVFLLAAKTRWRRAFWATLSIILTALIFVAPLDRFGLAHANLVRGLWVLGLVLILLAYFGKLPQKFGSRLALIALALVVVYWGGLWTIHRRALQRAQKTADQLAAQNHETIQKVAAMPTLADASNWLCVAETERATYRFNLSLWDEDEREALGAAHRLEKPQGCEAEALELASQDERAKVFLDFARFPLVRVEGNCLDQMLVDFADARFNEPGRGRNDTFSLEIPVERQK